MLEEGATEAEQLWRCAVLVGEATLHSGVGSFKVLQHAVINSQQ